MKKFLLALLVLTVFFGKASAQFGGIWFGTVSGGGAGAPVDSNNFATTNSLRAADSANALRAKAGVSTRVPFYSGGLLTTSSDLTYSTGSAILGATTFQAGGSFTSLFLTFGSNYIGAFGSLGGGSGIIFVDGGLRGKDVF